MKQKKMPVKALYEIIGGISATGCKNLMFFLITS
jgi:hypothetical protein